MAGKRGGAAMQDLAQGEELFSLLCRGHHGSSLESPPAPPGEGTLQALPPSTAKFHSSSSWGISSGQRPQKPGTPSAETTFPLLSLGAGLELEKGWHRTLTRTIQPGLVLLTPAEHNDLSALHLQSFGLKHCNYRIKSGVK